MVNIKLGEVLARRIAFFNSISLSRQITLSFSFLEIVFCWCLSLLGRLLGFWVDFFHSNVSTKHWPFFLLEINAMEEQFSKVGIGSKGHKEVCPFCMVDVKSRLTVPYFFKLRLTVPHFFKKVLHKKALWTPTISAVLLIYLDVQEVNCALLCWVSCTFQGLCMKRAAQGCVQQHTDNVCHKQGILETCVLCPALLHADGSNIWVLLSKVGCMQQLELSMRQHVSFTLQQAASSWLWLALQLVQCIKRATHNLKLKACASPLLGQSIERLFPHKSFFEASEHAFW